MKYLFTSFFIFIYSLSFSQKISPDMLVGKWKYESDSFQIVYIFCSKNIGVIKIKAHLGPGFTLDDWGPFSNEIIDDSSKNIFHFKMTLYDANNPGLISSWVNSDFKFINKDSIQVKFGQGKFEYFIGLHRTP